MTSPRIAVISFPGTNGDTENLRAFWRNGFEAFVFRWNDSREKLNGVDGYFIGAGFSYEDRGRAGMVAARDPLFQFLHDEAENGKMIIGHCNGCQVLVESGLIPLGKGLRMSVARNAVRADGGWNAPGFLNEWIHIARTCARDRCATSDWVDSTGSPFDEVMCIPIAHGEGRFVTRDPDLIATLEANDQIAFRYCDAQGNISEDPAVTPNGSTGAIAGICNSAGNVVALMPHPERTTNGDLYFRSMRRWLGRHQIVRRGAPLGRPVEGIASADVCASSTCPGRPDGAPLRTRAPHSVEIFIDTIIVNNEERTVEQAARRVVPGLKLRQFRYIAPSEKSAEEVLMTVSMFNPNKEIAFVRTCVGAPRPSTRSSLRSDRCGASCGARAETSRTEHPVWFRWNPDRKTLEPTGNPTSETTFLRRDEPDVGAQGLGEGSETGVCYSVSQVSSDDLRQPPLREIFANPHASMLEILL